VVRTVGVGGSYPEYIRGFIKSLYRNVTKTEHDFYLPHDAQFFIPTDNLIRKHALISSRREFQINP
jgi:hypothetical protein